ncbi:hypothetical protein [Streptomyces subrutilus]|uniref:hypothetical protein n=1 Tax=Streptomyces subrutilus TaxID=36818 RepID=UPI00340B4CC3
MTLLLDEALEQLDRRFAAATVEDEAGLLRRELADASFEVDSTGWWWSRRPEPAPWVKG